jgi:uncharacterized protein
MKSSRFNLFYSYEDGTILGYNSRTRGLIDISKDEYEAFKLLSEGKTPDDFEPDDLEHFIKELSRGQFLVDDDIDELIQMKAAYHVTRFLSRFAGLTLVVTHKCNLACSYCYENREPYSLSEDKIPIIMKIGEEMIKNKQAKMFSLSWYGGEPLLRPKFIDKASKEAKKLCEKYGIEYSSTIVTNGTLLTRDIAEMLKEHKVKEAQLTLDGPPEVHDKRRIFKNGKGSFDIILNNIKASHDLLKIAVRVNVDVHNRESVIGILDIMEKEGLKSGVSLYFAPVSPMTEKCSSFADDCFSKEEFSKMEVELLSESLNRGFIVDKARILPRTTTINCAAVSVDTFLIDSKCLLQKCWNLVGDEDEAISVLPSEMTEAGDVQTILEKLPKKDNISKWLASDPFQYDKCNECSILPTCLGGCPYHTVCKKTEPVCPTWKYNIKERIWLYRQSAMAEAQKQ